ncbi:hypothetical protein W02_42610 [Nitrospira sp. KM1]|uniref:glycosyltransferase family 2 protein n=1 Tax=Nitrospira sp. KM1 TaxID=1936990 RepID=UPI0013A744E0|nr:glycosyltransferase family 2 protein [Nitrospira sp. KM1]BCA57121.1 hypothetical protein W02_42610 [Nitrospira sp. KM1]
MPSTTSKPKLTILTPSFNQGRYIEQTIDSVRVQDYGPVEHIVIDGGSTDGTVDLLRRYPHVNWISEADRGQADALNKGLARATGDIIGWINSDDYYEPNIFTSVMQCFEDPVVMWVVGNLTYVREGAGEMTPDKSPPVSFNLLMHNPDIVRQAPVFYRKSFVEQAGGWNCDYFMAMDFDLWTRLAKLSPPRMVDRNWAYFRIHPNQKTSHANVIRQKKEIVTILRRERAHWSLIASLFLRKRWYWAKGLVKEYLIAAGLHGKVSPTKTNTT